MSVNLDKQVWTCYAGCGGGSVIDLLSKLDGVSIRDFCVREGIGKDDGVARKPFSASRSFFKRRSEAEKPQKPAASKDKSEIDKIYSYQDALGHEVYQVVRFKPKDFRQRHKENNEWVWSMQNVERVLYHLPEVLQSPSVYVCEGEKDVDSLIALGIMATCNVGGAGKWLESYSAYLAGKDVVICGDNDEPGQAHVRQVFDSVAGKAKTVKVIKLPKTAKDVSEFIATFKDPSHAKRALDDLRDEAHPFVQGVEMPVYSMSEIQPLLRKHYSTYEERAFDLSKWLPGMKVIGSLIPGDMIVLIGDTGSGKTGVASSIALAALPMPTLFFELELSVERLAARLIASRCKCTREEIKKSYLSGASMSEEDIAQHFNNLYICPKAKLTVEKVEEIIIRSELKLGERPRVVVLDYIQLMQGRGERYERMSDAIEQLRVVAKATQTILFVLSQVHRPKDGELEIGKYSAKESGSIENSASVLLGIWRDAKDRKLMHIKVLKNNEGESGHEILCNFDGERMLINERARVDDEDVPQPKQPKVKQQRLSEPAPTPYKDE